MLFRTDKPSKPNNLHVIEVLKDQIVLAWEPPTSLGNCPLKGYVIEKRDAKRNTWMPVQNVDSATVTFAVQKLLEGNEYFFRVAAENEIGVGEAAELFDGIVAKSPYGESCFGCPGSLPFDTYIYASAISVSPFVPPASLSLSVCLSLSHSLSLPLLPHISSLNHIFISHPCSILAKILLVIGTES